MSVRSLGVITSSAFNISACTWSIPGAFPFLEVWWLVWLRHVLVDLCLCLGCLHFPDLCFCCWTLLVEYPFKLVFSVTTSKLIFY
jgi:hypothetical protein